MNNKTGINEALTRFNQIMGYSPNKGIITERKVRRTYLSEDEPTEGEDVEGGDNPEFDFGGEPNEGEGNPEFDFGGGEPQEGGEEEVDEFGTADEFSAADEIETVEGDVEEIDVTSIVNKSDEAREAAQQAVTISQQNSEYLKSMNDTITNLTTQLSKMDTILSRVNKLETTIKTPEEKLELRSLDSYPFNLKLTDYWNDKASENDNYDISGGETTVNGQKKEYTISKSDIDDYNESDIKNSFMPESKKGKKIK